MIKHRPSQWRLWMVSTLLGLGAGLCAVQPAAAQKQQGSVKKPKADKPDRAPDDTVPLSKFFESEDPLPITLTLNIKRIRGDKDDQAPWRDATITYTPPGASAPEVLPLKLKTHGIWRLNHCEFPPIRLDFSKDNTKKTIFAGLNKPKLTNFCRDDDTYERYVLQELQAYRVYWTTTFSAYQTRSRQTVKAKTRDRVLGSMIRCPSCGIACVTARPTAWRTARRLSPARDRGAVDAVRGPEPGPAGLPRQEAAGAGRLRRRVPGRARLSDNQRAPSRSRAPTTRRRATPSCARPTLSGRRLPPCPRGLRQRPLPDGSRLRRHGLRQGAHPGRRHDGARRSGAARGLRAHAIPILIMEVAHGTGLVHCDLKPENVFVHESFGAKLFDFGLVRR